VSRTGPLPCGTTAVVVAAGTAPFAAGALFTGTVSGPASALARSAPAPFTAAFRPFVAAFVMGIKFGRGRLLRPRGEKEFLKIQLVFR
jgi:hypothetical protein